MLGELIYDNVEGLERLVNNEVSCCETKKKMRGRLEAVTEYMIFYYSGHIGLDRDVDHCKNHSLHGSARNGETSGTSECKSCLAPFQVRN